MKHKKWMPRLLAGGLVTASLMGVALAAAREPERSSGDAQLPE